MDYMRNLILRRSSITYVWPHPRNNLHYYNAVSNSCRRSRGQTTRTPGSEAWIEVLSFDREAPKGEKILKSSNETPRILTSSSVSLAPSRSRQTLQATTLESIRKKACGVHDVPESDPCGCNCSLPHNANLRLEALGVGDNFRPAYLQRSLPTRFRFVLSFDTKSQTQTIPP
jgi:hypothetical protein